jgi:hypothetical protein
MEVFEELPLFNNQRSFRLIEFCAEKSAADAHDATVSLKMETFDCLTAPEYEALSYTWGQKLADASIYVNGQLYPVTPNLLAALHQLRVDQNADGGIKKRLWIDAICINQSAHSEKNQQVAQMKEVFAHASGVVIWLGISDNLTGLAFDTLERFAADDGTSDGSVTFRALEDTIEERRTAVNLLFQRSWFSRVWIIQEVVVTRRATVLCGTFRITFDRLDTAVQRMTGSGFIHFSTTTSNVAYLGEWRRFFLNAAAAQRDEFLDAGMFMDARDRGATDPRDKIYALRGIASGEVAAGIKVDYDKTIERVYTDFAKHQLTSRPDLRILSAVILRHKRESPLHLPSWVPDWNQPKWGGGILNRYYRFKPTSLFKAAGRSKPMVHLMADSDTISLQGTCLDTVERIIDVKSILEGEERGSYYVTQAILRDIAADVISVEKYPFTDEPHWKALFRTLTADRTALSPRINEGYRKKFFGTLGDLNVNDEDLERSLSDAAWAEVSKSVGQIIEDKDIFLTTKGYLGLGQEGFQIGDIICVFSGGEVPFLLRHISLPEDRKFQLLSECYVHGVMDGEALQGRNDTFLETFLIA